MLRQWVALSKGWIRMIGGLGNDRGVEGLSACCSLILMLVYADNLATYLPCGSECGEVCSMLHFMLSRADFAC